MTSERTNLLGRSLACALLLLLCLLLLLAAFQKQHWDSDIFWALKSGEWISLNRAVPRTDPFSYTFRGVEWIDFTWGFQVIAWFYYSKFWGWTGLFILQVLITGPTFIFMYLNARKASGANSWVPPLILFLVFISSYPRLFIRPHLFEYFFISLYLLLLNLHEGGEGGGPENGAPAPRARTWYVFILIPLQILWMNIHSSAVIGVFITGAYALGAVFDEMKGKYMRGGLGLRYAFSPSTKSLIFTSLALPAASLINPYGLKLLVFPFLHTSGENSDAIRHIGEWAKIGIGEMLMRLYPYPLHQLAWKLLFTGAAVLLLLNIRRVKARDAVIFLGAAYLSNTHVRWVAQFGYLVAPLLASNLSGLINAAGEGGAGGGGRAGTVGRAGRAESGRAWLRRGGIALNALMAVMMTVELFRAPVRENYGIGLKSGIYPDASVAFMKREKIRGNIFNEYVFGGYLIFNYPEVPVFIDGRTPTVYSPYFFWTARLADKPGTWNKLVKEHGIDIVLIKHNSKHCENLRKDGAWKAVYFDDVSVLFLKNSPAFADVIKRHGLKSTNPCSNEPRYELPTKRETLEKMEEEIKGIAYYEGGEGGVRGVSASRPHRLLGLVKSGIGGGRIEEAVEEFRRSLKIKDAAFTRYDLGVALGKLGRRDDSLKAFKKAVKMDRNFKDAYLAMGLTYYGLKDYKNAACWLRKYTLLADDSSEYNALKTLGLAYFNLSDFPSALIYLRRAAYLSDNQKERGHLYYHIGNSLFEMREYVEGALYYGLSLKEDPGYRGVLGRLLESFRSMGEKEKSAHLEDLLSS